MLRERKASMAERSLSSLTGELLLLATDAAGFATFPARRLVAEVGNTLGGKGVGCHDDGSGLGAIVEGVGFFKSTPGDSRNHHPSTAATRAVDGGRTPRRGGGEEGGARRTDIKGGEGPGAMWGEDPG